MSVHPDIVDLLPWYVNGTVSDMDRSCVEAHLLECASCRAQLDIERRVEEAMRIDNGIEYMPTVSLKRLHSMLDTAAAQTETTPAVTLDDSAASSLQRPRVAVPYKVAAAALLAIAALGVLMLTRYQQPSLPSGVNTGYYTVTLPTAQVRGEVIRAVFSSAITLTELERILGEARLRIVSGPTEAGVYSLASDATLPVAESLRMLRQHDGVRFAESTRPLTEPEPAR